MAIDFNTTFGDRSRRTAGSTARGNANQDLPKAQVWLNIGFVAGEGEQEKFVSLPTGIPLDTMERVNTRVTNEDFAQFQAARNDLLEQFMEAASQLAPGESKIVTMEVQIRRVNDEHVERTVEEGNPYARRLVA